MNKKKSSIWSITMLRTLREIKALSSQELEAQAKQANPRSLEYLKKRAAVHHETIH